MGGLSLYYDDDSIFSERVVVLFSLSYFSVDILDCLQRDDLSYFIHGLLSLGLSLVNYTTPLCRQIRTNSRAAMCQLSSPLMHNAKVTHSHLMGLAFMIVFTRCRIIWIPYGIVLPMHRAGMPWTDLRMIAVLCFYGLNMFWYYKIWLILLSAASKSSHEHRGQSTGATKKER